MAFKSLRYNGTAQANGGYVNVVTISTTPITTDTTFDIDILYGGRAMDNPTIEASYIYRYMITARKTGGPTITILQTQTIVSNYINACPLTIATSGTDIILQIPILYNSSYDQGQLIYDCYLNYT